MNSQKEQIPQQTRAGQQVINSASDAEAQADSLLERAHELTEQAGRLDTLSVETQYSTALAAQVESKHAQAERIEDRLENLIEQQSSRLQQARAQPPGLIALPGSRSKWQQQVQQQQGTLQRLQGRLEIVREIKDGMGVHGAHIEELAARKLRRLAPGLASEWDEQQEAQRQHMAMLRKKEQEHRQSQGLTGGKGWSLSNTLNGRNPS